MALNTLHAALTVSFKGETYALEHTFDLDACPVDLDQPDCPPNFHRLLAQAAGVDLYSYLYEAMEAEDITFSAPTGVAKQAFAGGVFDWPHYAVIRQQARDWKIVESIAAQHLGDRDFVAEPALKAALLAVYQAGRSS